MRKKTELIQQIRAMESVPVIRHKFVDITESSGHGLLLEMSIAEVSLHCTPPQNSSSGDFTLICAAYNGHWLDDCMTMSCMYLGSTYISHGTETTDRAYCTYVAS